MNRLLTLAVALSAGAFAAAPAAAGPVRLTFRDCGAYADCSAGSTVLTAFDSAMVPQAPAVPPAGTLTPADALDVLQVVAGSFFDVGLETFNTNGVIGSMFVFEALQAANGAALAPVTAVGPAFVNGLHLSWGLGHYTGLARVGCYVVDCSITTPIQAYMQLDVTLIPDTATVPEPSTAALGLLALGGLAALRRRP